MLDDTGSALLLTSQISLKNVANSQLTYSLFAKLKKITVLNQKMRVVVNR